MEFQLPITIPKPERPIRYEDSLALIGSCFTGHIGNHLQELKFNVLQNPHGILFDSLSVCNSLNSYIENRQYTAADLFLLNECWQSWQHHSDFSGTDQAAVLEKINRSQQQAHTCLKSAAWLFITLGSSFSYRLSETIPAEQAAKGWTGQGVANCHRAPGQWFVKHLMEIEETKQVLQQTLETLFAFNTNIRVIFTVSPVRHIRDGVTENNRSKARLIETVHHLVQQYEQVEYFPAYELVIDVLRDYRFYDIDMVHPNYAATRFVMEKFTENYIHPDTQAAMQEVQKIVTARKHKPFHPETSQHKAFLKNCLEKTQQLQAQYPFLDFGEELTYFSITS
jgi:GSCFA family